LGGMAGFSSPNTLGFGGYSPGPGAAYTRIGSIGITPPGPATSASIDVFHFDSGTGNSIVFIALRNGQEVARDTLVVQGGFGVRHTQFHITGVTFDELRLAGEGPNDQGVFFGLADNVTVGASSECYANCDQSTTPPTLNINDFVCFQALFAAGDTNANCDGSTTPPILNVNDFVCFQAAFAAGCH